MSMLPSASTCRSAIGSPPTTPGSGGTIRHPSVRASAAHQAYCRPMRPSSDSCRQPREMPHAWACYPRRAAPPSRRAGPDGGHRDPVSPLSTHLLRTLEQHHGQRRRPAARGSRAPQDVLSVSADSQGGTGCDSGRVYGRLRLANGYAALPIMRRKRQGWPNGERVRRWFQAKKAGWFAVLADPQMPVTSTLLDQAHNTIERKLFAMKGFHHPGGSQQAFLTGLAHLYNLIPYQRRALNARKCGVEAEGGRVPTSNWMLNLQILTSGGYQCAPAPPNH